MKYIIGKHKATEGQQVWTMESEGGFRRIGVASDESRKWISGVKVQSNTYINNWIYGSDTKNYPTYGNVDFRFVREIRYWSEDKWSSNCIRAIIMIGKTDELLGTEGPNWSPTNIKIEGMIYRMKIVYGRLIDYIELETKPYEEVIIDYPYMTYLDGYQQMIRKKNYDNLIRLGE